VIAYKDFVPTELSAGGWFQMPTREQLSECLTRASEWILVNKLDVINVETVVLPNIHSAGKEGSKDVQIRISGERSAYWYQFIRVWYHKSSEAIPEIRRK
jgi:hypothetical protein